MGRDVSGSVRLHLQFHWHCRERGANISDGGRWGDGGCGLDTPGYQQLGELAAEWRRRSSEVTQMRAERGDLDAEVKRLKNQRKNLLEEVLKLRSETEASERALNVQELKRAENEKLLEEQIEEI